MSLPLLWLSFLWHEDKWNWGHRAVEHLPPATSRARLSPAPLARCSLTAAPHSASKTRKKTPHKTQLIRMTVAFNPNWNVSANRFTLSGPQIYFIDRQNEPNESSKIHENPEFRILKIHGIDLEIIKKIYNFLVRTQHKVRALQHKCAELRHLGPVVPELMIPEIP